MTVFMAFCGLFCGPICECLWHVQMIVLGPVLVTKYLVYGMFKGLF